MAAPMVRYLGIQKKQPNFFCIITLCSKRHCETSTAHVKKRKRPVTIPSLPPDNPDNDWIGPPDKVSNIRVMKFCIPPNETAVEREYRERREALQKWHHQFWTKHNKSFFQKKEEFIQRKLEEKSCTEGSEEEESVSAEELSVFYKQFLDENYETHAQYNREWYRKNISLLWPAFKVQIVRLWLWRERRKHYSNSDT